MTDVEHIVFIPKAIAQPIEIDFTLYFPTILDVERMKDVWSQHL